MISEMTGIGALNTEIYTPVQQKVESTNEDLSVFNSEVTSEMNSEPLDNEEKKVTFKEGIGLVFKGFANKVKNIATSIIKHPIKTLAAVGATTALIAAAPIVGISCATAGSLLALGFGAYAIGKTAYDVVETVKDNKEGRYNEVRDDLQNIGGDGVDLALSLPFMPKAIKQVGRFVKYGRSSVGLNTELISNLSKCTSFKGIRLELAKADTLINYDMIGNEMGLAVKPEIKFYNKELGTTSIAGEYEPTTGKLYLNENILYGKGKATLRMQGLDTESILRHELEHFKQFSDIAKAQGVEGVKNAIIEYYKNAYQSKGGNLDIMSEEEYIKILKENSSVSYEDVIKSIENEIKASRKEFQKPYDQMDFTECDRLKIKTKELTDKFELECTTRKNAAQKRIFDSNNRRESLELLKKAGVNKDVAENMLFGDQSSFNGEFYQDVINSQGTIEAESAQAAKASEYATAFSVGKTNVNKQTFEELAEKFNITDGDALLNSRQYQKFQIELYKTNLLEKEAYAAQDAYTADVIKMRPDAINDALMADSRAEEYFTDDDTNLFRVTRYSLFKAKSPQVNKDSFFKKTNTEIE